MTDTYRDRTRAIPNRHEDRLDAAAANEKRTQHPEERELPPETTVEAVETPNDGQAAAPGGAPGPRGGDQS